MSKVETTKRSVMYQYHTLVQVGYCALYHLLSAEYPQAYTHGVYGWNADIYDMSNIYQYGVGIVTGYRPFGHVSPPYELVREYEEKARSLAYDGDRKARLRILLAEFLSKVLEGKNV